MLLGVITALSAVLSLVLCGATGRFDGLQWLWMIPVYYAGCWAVLAVLAVLIYWIMAAVVNLDRPQQKDSPFYRRALDFMAEAIVTLLQIRMKTSGLENVPAQGRFLLVCNHLHVTDPVVLLRYFRNSQLAFISKQENNRLFLVGKLMHKILCQPINRENDREALKTILRCIQLLKDDLVSVAVFPEGYTSRSGKLQPFRSGVFKIAQKANVPIVVCTLKNTQNVFYNAIRLRPTYVDLDLLEVIPAAQLKGMTTVDIGQRVHEIMENNLGPDYLPEQV